MSLVIERMRTAVAAAEAAAERSVLAEGISMF